MTWKEWYLFYREAGHGPILAAHLATSIWVFVGAGVVLGVILLVV